MAEPYDQVLPRLRQLYGMDPADFSRDDELMAYFDVALASARSYTHRWLAPVAQFSDFFQQVASCCRCQCGCAAVLAEVPVQSIDAVTRDGGEADPEGYVAGGDGTLYERQGLTVVEPAYQVMRVNYAAGYEPLPPDLAEALCQIAAAASPSTSGASVGGGAVHKMTVFDVGSVEFSGTPGGFFAGGMTSSSALLGGWATALDPYRDLSKSLGAVPGCLHESEQVTGA